MASYSDETILHHANLATTSKLVEFLHYFINRLLRVRLADHFRRHNEI
jgi:hypothetical protein